MASHELKTLFYIFKDFKGLRTSLPTAKVFALLRTSLPTTKKEPSFGALYWDRLKPKKKRYLYCALKHRLVK